MDITQYNTTVASDNAQTLSLKDPFTDELLIDEDGKTVDIYLYGIQSTAARNAVAERERKSNKKDLTDEQSKELGAEFLAKLTVGKSNKKDLTDEQSKELGAEFLAKLTVGWSENIEVEGEKLKHTYNNAVALYMEQDWIGQQVIAFVSSLENYDPKA